MKPQDRQKALAARVAERGAASVEALAAEFAVSAETVRRDLARLAGAGLVQKVHGGARAAAVAPDTAAYRSTGQRPTNVEDEPNTDLVKGVWKRVLEGATAEALEQELPVDSYRIRRLLEHWLSEGSLEISVSS